MESTRRDFLKTASVATVGTAALSAASYAKVGGAMERFTVGVIGPGGMGTSHIRTLVEQRDIDIAYVCDVDRGRLDTAVKNATQGDRAPRGVGDLRRVLEDRNVHAVFIAMPDHWHGPAAILALDAGKHVYVEKPASHNLREGRLMIEAARRNRKVCQVGTQSRSTEHVKSAMQLLHDGAIGEVLTVRVWNSQLRRNIGRQKPTPPPATLDYENWVGPAAFLPHQANRLHGVWRWWFNFGTGDMGNDGVHDLDIGRWGLGVEVHPNTVTALGGKYFFDDDQEFPDTQTVIFEWNNAAKAPGRKKQLIFEQRIWSPYVQEGHENGNAFYGTNGMMIFGKGSGWRLYGPRNKEVKSMTGTPDLLAHHRNFFDSIRNGAVPSADIAIGHLSSSLCHLGNIATRLRRVLTFDPKTEEITADKEAQALTRRTYRDHFGTPRGA